MSPSHAPELQEREGWGGIEDPQTESWISPPHLRCEGAGARGGAVRHSNRNCRTTTNNNNNYYYYGDYDDDYYYDY